MLLFCSLREFCTWKRSSVAAAGVGRDEVLDFGASAAGFGGLLHLPTCRCSEWLPHSSCWEKCREKSLFGDRDVRQQTRSVTGGDPGGEEEGGAAGGALGKALGRSGGLWGRPCGNAEGDVLIPGHIQGPSHPFPLPRGAGKLLSRLENPTMLENATMHPPGCESSCRCQGKHHGGTQNPPNCWQNKL